MNKLHLGISRRHFLKGSAVAIAATSSLNSAAARVSAPVEKPFTVIAYNVYKCNGWPNDNKWAVKARTCGQMPARLAAELALYDADVINFSESPEEAVVKEIAGRLNMQYVFLESGGNWPGAILSKHRLEDSANAPVKGGRSSDLFTRHWGKASVKLSDGLPVTIHSAHLFPHDTPEARSIREREIKEILKIATADLSGGRSVIIMGDLNHTPAMPEYDLWREAGWTDTFSSAGTGEGFTIRCDSPDKRIDYVLAKGPLTQRILEARVLFERGFRTNPDDPASFALSDHLPQLAVFNI